MIWSYKFQIHVVCSDVNFILRITKFGHLVPVIEARVPEGTLFLRNPTDTPVYLQSIKIS